MIWRRRWILLLPSPRRLLPSSSPVHSAASPRLHSTASSNPEPESRQSRPRRKLRLTPQAVRSTISSCPSDLIALRLFLCCAKQPDYFHDRSAVRSMVGVLVRLTDRHESVRGVVSELESIGCSVKPQTFFILMRIYWAGGLYFLLLEAFLQMRSFGFACDTFARNMVMDVLFKIGRADFALEFLRETQVPNFLTFNIALCNLCRMSDLINAGDVIRSMLKRGYYPSAEAFQMLLSSFCVTGKLSEAFQVLSYMIILGIPISPNTWRTLIDGYCRLGSFEMAESLLEKMEQTGCAPNIVIYTTVIKRYFESGMVSEAFRVLRTMELKGISPDLVLCNVLIDSLTKSALYDNAFDVFLSMSAWKLEPDAYTFSSLVSTIIHSRRFSDLPRLMRGVDVEADLVVCNSLLSYLCKAGSPSLAVDLYMDMVGGGLAVDRYSFVGLLCGLCRIGKVEEAVNIYGSLLSEYPSLLDAHVHTAIVHRLIKVGKYHQAIRLFKNAMIQNYPLDAISYTVAIHGLLLAGRSSEASALFDKMKKIGLSPNAHTYNVMIAGFAKEKDGEMVMSLLKEMIDARSPLRHNSFQRVVNLLSRPCYWRSALELLLEMRDLQLLPSDAAKLFSGEFSEGVHIGDMNFVSKANSTGSSSGTDTSCSEDICDVAASVG